MIFSIPSAPPDKNRVASYTPGESLAKNQENNFFSDPKSSPTPPLSKREVQEISTFSCDLDTVIFVAKALWVTLLVVAWIVLFVATIIMIPPAGILVAKLLPVFFFVAFLPVCPELALECCVVFAHLD